jgi:hypothetical protein
MDSIPELLFTPLETEDNPAVPWSERDSIESTTVDEERSKLLDAISGLEIVNVEHRVARILQRFPECRDSDTELAIKYWKQYEPEKIAAHKPLTLEVLHDLQNITTIVRCRQHIQNDLGLFTGSPRTRRRRGDLQLELYQYLSDRRKSENEIVIYLDETGTDGQSMYMGIGGVCILDTRQYELNLHQFRKWRETYGPTQKYHFADVTSVNLAEYLDLTKRLRKHRNGLLFFGYAVECRGSFSHRVADLTVQLLSDTCHYLRINGCLDRPRDIRVVKEAEAFFDLNHLDALKSDAQKHLYREFGSSITLTDIQPRPKGNTVLLECADLIAAAMRRRYTSSSSIHKDQLADAVFGATGLNDSEEQGAIFKIYR